MTAQSKITGTRVLVAPEHIRGPMRRETDEALKQARAEWLQSLPDGTLGTEVARALGVSDGQAALLLRQHRGPRSPKPARLAVYRRGLKMGWTAEAVVNGMTWEQQDKLESRCAKTGESIAEALVAFWAEAHK